MIAAEDNEHRWVSEAKDLNMETEENMSENVKQETYMRPKWKPMNK